MVWFWYFTICSGAGFLLELGYARATGGRRGNLRGRVCPFFSAAWGLLSLPLLYWLQPVLRLWAEGIPPAVTAACAAAVGGDLLISAWMLRLTGSRDCLRWYQKR